MNNCIFCKRYLKDCYNIFVASEETDNVAPNIDILYFFGNSGLQLIKEQYICHPCLFLIRMLKYIREALEAVLKCDKNLDHLITCFEKFKTLLQAVDYGVKDTEEDNHVESEFGFPENSTIYASDNDYDEYLVELPSDCVYYDSNYSRSPTPTSQEVEQVFSKRKKRKRRKSTNWTHRKRSSRASIQSRATSRASSRKSRTKSRASNASGTRSQQPSRHNNENGFLLNKTRSVCYTQNKNLARLVEMENSEYPCLINVCFKRHKSFDELLEHTRRDHNLLNEDLTEEIYNEQLKLYEERKQEKERTKLKFTLSTHCVVQQEEDKYPCLIDQCYQKFYNFNNYIHHKIEGHNLFAKYWCRECNSLKFSSEEDYIKHNKMKHSYSINCLVCSEKMDNIYDLQEHLEKHKYICIACKYCDKSYLDYYSLLQHKETHNNEKTEKIPKRAKGSILELYYCHSNKNKIDQSVTNLDFINIRIQKQQKTAKELEEEDYNRYIISRRDSDESIISCRCTPFSEHSNDIDLDGTVFNNEDFEVIEQELNHENEFNLNTLLEDISHPNFEDNVFVVTETESFKGDSSRKQKEILTKTNLEEIKNIIGTVPENVVIKKGIDFCEENTKESAKQLFVPEIIEDRIDDVGEDSQLDEQMLDHHEVNEEDNADLVLEGFNEEVSERDENTEEFIENKIIEEDHCEEVVVEGYHITGDAVVSNVCYDSEEVVRSVPIENSSEIQNVVESKEKISVESKTENLELKKDSNLMTDDETETIKQSQINYKYFEALEESTEICKKKNSLKLSKKKKESKAEEPMDNLSRTIFEVSKGITKEYKKESNLYDLFIGNRNKNKPPKESPIKQNLYDTFIRRNSNDNDSKQRKQNYKNKYNPRISPTKQLKPPEKVNSPEVPETIDKLDHGPVLKALKKSSSKQSELQSNETITKEDVVSNANEDGDAVKVPRIVEEVYVQAVDPNALYNSPTHAAQESTSPDTPVSSNKRSRRISNPRKSDNNDKVLQFIEAIEKSRLEKLKQKPPDEEVQLKVEVPEVVKSPSPTKVVEQKLNNSIDSVIEQVKSRITSPTRKNKRKPDKTSKLCVEEDSGTKERTKRLGMSNVVKKVTEKNNGQEKTKKILSEELKSVNSALYTSSAYKHVKKKFKK